MWSCCYCPLEQLGIGSGVPDSSREEILTILLLVLLEMLRITACAFLQISIVLALPE